MLFNTDKSLKNSKRIHLTMKELSAFETIPDYANKRYIRTLTNSESDNMLPRGEYGTFQVYHIRPRDLSRFARSARSPP